MRKFDIDIVGLRQDHLAVFALTLLRARPLVIPYKTEINFESKQKTLLDYTMRITQSWIRFCCRQFVSVVLIMYLFLGFCQAIRNPFRLPTFGETVTCCFLKIPCILQKLVFARTCPTCQLRPHTSWPR